MFVNILFTIIMVFYTCKGCHAAWFTPSQLPVVILRMDDVAARSCEQMTKTAIDAVLAKNTPISVGVIANDIGLSTHEPFASYLRSIASNDLVEIFSHSYSHDDYTDHDLYWQIDDIATSQGVINSVTGALPRTLSPPLNTFNSETLEAMLNVDYMEVFTSKCAWNRNVPGEVIDCDAPGAVEAPNILTGGSYHLPAGAVLGGTSYWNNKIQAANLSEAIRWIDTQISQQNFSVVLLHPYEFSTSTECVTVDADKIAVLESLIDYGVGKYQFMTFQEAVMYFANDTTIFSIEDPADAKFGFQAKFNLLVVFCLTGCVFVTACLSFCRTSTEQKIQKKDRIAAEMKRKKDIDAKLKNQRHQRNIELKTQPGKPGGSAPNKKVKHADYSKI